MWIPDRKPLVSIVMPAYNAEKYLINSIESILNQTLNDFEFIIINDGSTDNTPNILKFYERYDKRIIVYHQQNKGLISSLNIGCQIARAKYIARMDADDISLPDRLEKQIIFLEKNQHVGVLGSWVKVIDISGNIKAIWRFPIGSKLVEWSLLFRNCIAHPTVLMRKNIIEEVGFYRFGYDHIEDYDLWMRLRGITQFDNIPEALLLYRTRDGSVCSKNAQIQDKKVAELIMQPSLNSTLGYPVPIDQITTLREISMKRYPLDLIKIKQATLLIIRLFNAFNRNNSLDNEETRIIAMDTSSRLYGLARSQLRVAPLLSMIIIICSVMMYPLIFLRFIRSKLFRR